MVDVRKQQDIALKNVQNLSKINAVKFFMKNSDSTSKQYTEHVMKIFKEFDEVKEENLRNKELLGQITNSIIFLERGFIEMKAIITHVLNEVFETVENKQLEIEEAVIQKLPEGVVVAKKNRDNALGLYCFYINLMRPIDLENNVQILQEDQELLQQQLRVKELEFETQNVLLNQYIKKEQDL